MNKADLLAGLKKRPVPVEVNGVTLHLKPLTVAEKEKFALWRKDNPGGAGVVGRLLAASLCDEAGAPILDAPEDANDLDGAVADVLCERILDINGMRGADAKKEPAPIGQS